MFSEFRRDCEKLVPEYASYLEEPPKGLADLALPCFSLAREMKKSLQQIAREIAAGIRIPKNSLVEKIEANGPYVNFFIDYSSFTQRVMKAAAEPDYGSGKLKNEVIAIESPGPNTNKPLHLGHVRNMVLGSSLERLFSFSGFKTVKVDIINDRGIHICKSMLAYEKLGHGRQPDKKSDHFVGDFYVLFTKELEGRPETDKELRQMLLDWENDDRKIRELWMKMRTWALDGFQQTYRRLGTRINKAYYESDHYHEGKNIVLDGLKKGIFKKDDEGNIITDLEKWGLGKRVLLRPDGTSVYLTQDLALGVRRYQDFKFDRMIHVVASEQTEHFRALFKIYEMLDYPFADGCFHLAYGMVNLPEGKMKSREGTVVDADNLLDELHSLAAEEIGKREPDISGEDLKERAEKIALAAIKFFLLKFDSQKTITYDPKASISFEGDTGPYLLYTYARTKSVLRKSEKVPEHDRLGDEEKPVIKKLSLFPEIAAHAAREYKPHIVATYALELAAAFNEYYHSVKIINSDKEAERLMLLTCVSNVLGSCMNLLGIEPLEKM
jgi:arginyl-tRNA synthetase